MSHVPSSPLRSEAPLRILLVDDHATMRATLRTVLVRQKAIAVEIVGEAENGLDALTAVAHHRPDLVLMDVEMPCMDGVETTRRLAVQFPGIRIVGWTMCDAATTEAMRAAGAAVVLSKDAGLGKLVDAIQSLFQADVDLPPEAA
ncbi:MAG TPA: response regulator transcription factor [Pirellulaceae bacterium]|jgi:DNA-binding NarL/FixJ family response regulator|nr:response regulator transcription factor [Pirellulaceae bacterium]